MLRTKLHNGIFKQLFLLSFILFSLSPCAVKEVVFSNLNIEYSQPFNKTKTTSSSSNCNYASSAVEQIFALKKSKIYQEKEAEIFAQNTAFKLLKLSPQNVNSKNSSENSLPKYILYKRLKINII